MTARRSATTPSARLCGVLATTLVTLACSAPAPGMIHYDSDACDHCRMTIADPAFSAQLVTQTGKVYRFDDPGCLASFVTSGRVADPDVHSLWVNDHAHPETLVKATDAVFVVSDRIRAPMNSRTAAFASRDSAAALQAQVGGRLQGWSDVLKRVSS